MDTKIEITDTFWKRYKELVRTEMIPYQWKVLNDEAEITIEKERNDDSIPSEKSHAIENFKIAAGRKNGEHYGWVFQDSDVYKWLEAVAYSLNDHPDESLKAIADEVVDLIADAQEKDGYLDTYFTIMEPERKYKRLRESHELYCAGHFIEAAVAYNEATGNKKVLDTAIKLADHIDEYFGEEKGKIHGADGHEEIEIGLMRLYHLTSENRYLKLADYFLRVRGKAPDFFEKQCREDNKKPLITGMSSFPTSYFQVHLPVALQDTAEGHAVRLVYMCTALADIAASTGNKEVGKVCRKIWRNIIDRRMYITGGIGSTVIGESFTLDYDLPNDTMYCETCASIGLIFFARQMLRIEANGEYADVMERALYNTALAGMALDGRHFFYVNPLEVVPEKSKKDPTKSHVKSVRPQWLGCACCPPNLARLITSVEKNVYTVSADSILVNLYIQSKLSCRIKEAEVEIDLKADYPRSGEIAVDITNKGNEVVSVGIRLPDWADDISGKIDSSIADITTDAGYWYICADPGMTRIELNIGLEPKRWYASVNVSEDINKVAICRGPQVYCIEGVDNGKALHCLSLPSTSDLKYYWDDKKLGGVGIIEGDGIRYVMMKESSKLYTSGKPYRGKEPCRIKWIPYYAWANRGENEMRVWINEDA